MVFGPKTKSIRLLYGDTNFLLASTGLAPVARVFRANGMFDPDLTGLGHQPRGFDQLMAMYQKFSVTGIKVEAWLHAPEPGQSYVSPLPYILFSESSTVPTTFPDILETPTAVFADGCFGGTETASGTAASTGEGKYMSIYFDMVKLRGSGKDRQAYINDDQNQGSSSADPANQGYVHIGWIRNGGSSADTCTVGLTVRLTYYATLLEPVLPPIS